MQNCPGNNGCFYQPPSKCVIYDGPFLTNLSILPGQNLTDILRKIDMLISGGSGGGLQKVEHQDTSTASISGEGTISSPLTVTFLGTSTQLNSDWNANSGVTQILNKPNLSTVAISGSYNDLSNKPTIPSSPVNADWNSVSGLSQILNKPTISTVGTTGNYNDLTNKPNLSLYYLATNPSGYITSSSLTWNNITGKPTFSTVSTSGNYNDLINKPTIISPVNADWNAVSGLAQILNKPTIPAAQVNADWISSTGISRILNKPTTVSGFGITDVYTKTQSDGLYIPLSQRGTANGVATLDGSLHIPLSQINITTSNVAEGTNLYYTNARVQTFSDTRYVPLTRLLNVGTGLTGGGELSVDRTIDLDFSYLDDRYSSGYKQKESVKVASASNITLSGLQAVDGVALLVGDRILVKGQTDGSENGIYIVSSGAWARSTDFDSVGPGEVEQGAAIFVEDGTTLGKTGWSLSTGGTIVLDTTPLTFIQYSGATNYSAGTGLSLSGNSFFAQTTTALWNAATLRGVPIATSAPANNQILRYNGSTWSPFTPNYITSETDPIAIAKTITITGTSPITVTGAAQTIGNNPSFSLSHAVSGVTAGTYAKVSVNATGHITGASILLAGDIPNLDTSKITTGIFSTARLGSGTASPSTYLTGTGWTPIPAIPPGTVISVGLTSSDITVTGSPITSSGTFTLTLPNKLTAGNYKSVTVNAKGIVTAGANPTTLAGYGITDAAPISGSGNYIQNRNTVQSSSNFWISGIGKMGNTSGIVGNNTGLSNTSTLAFYESNGTTRVGYVGKGSTLNNDIYITSDSGNIALAPTGTGGSPSLLVTPFSLNYNGGTCNMTNSTSNNINLSNVGVAAPTFTTLSAGTKIRLYTTNLTAQVDYGIGIETSHTWFSTPTAVATTGFKFYGGTTLATRIGSTGLFETTGQGRFQGWYVTGANNINGPATEIGYTAGQGRLMAYDRTTNNYQPIWISGGTNTTTAKVFAINNTGFQFQGLTSATSVGTDANGYLINTTSSFATASHTHAITLTGAVTGSGTITGTIATTLANLDGAKITTGTVAGARLGSGSANYIQNGTALQASSNFNISGLGKAASLTVTGISTFGATGTTIGSFGEIHGKSTLTSDGTIYPIAGIFMDTGSSFTYTPGAGVGKIWTSDASGQASWATSTLQTVTSAGATTNVAITSSNTITATGFFNSSLRKLKTNIEIYNKSALEVLDKAKIYKFNYKNDLKQDIYGIIAEEAPKELLSESKESMNLYSTIGILIKAVKELKEEIKQLKYGLE